MEAEVSQEADINFIERAARQKVPSLPVGWTWFRWERVGGMADNPMGQGLLVTGAVCEALISKGPRRGHPNWKLRDKKTEARVFLSMKELDYAEISWESETGKCSRCKGSGKEWVGWSAADGSRFRSCSKCDSTGVADLRAAA